MQRAASQAMTSICRYNRGGRERGGRVTDHVNMPRPASQAMTSTCRCRGGADRAFMPECIGRVLKAKQPMNLHGEERFNCLAK